jgi:hypothetical protein
VSSICGQISEEPIPYLGKDIVGYSSNQPKLVIFHFNQRLKRVACLGKDVVGYSVN